MTKMTAEQMISLIKGTYSMPILIQDLQMIMT